MLRPWTKYTAVFLISLGIGACGVEGAHRLSGPSTPKGDLVEPSATFMPTFTFPVPGLITIRPQSVVGDQVSYTVVDDGLQLIPSDLLKDSSTACGVVLSPGKYRVRAIVAKDVGGVAHLSPYYEIVVQVGAPAPPTPPTPPIPPTPPTPPVPTAFRVLIVTDASTAMPSAQQKALTDPAVKAYLDSHSIKDGNQPGWRVWDKGTQVTGESDAWKAAFARPRASHPWIVIGNGTDNGFEGPLPVDSASLLILLKKYGGA